jgi:hypothetical protein
MERWLIAAAMLGLAACGSDDDNGFGNGGPIQSGDGGTAPPGPGIPGGGGGGGTGSTAPGLWYGVNRVDGSATDRYMEMLVTEEGDFVATADLSDAETFDFFGEDNGSEDSFDADNVETYNNYAPTTDSSIQGTVVPSMSFNGSISSGSISSQFTLTFSPFYTRSASLSKLQGVYSYSSPSGAVSVVVNADGDFTGVAYNGCTLEGDVTVPNPDRNYYRLDGTLEGCGGSDGAMSALIYLRDSNNATDDLMVLLGQTDSESTSFFLAAEK